VFKEDARVMKLEYLRRTEKFYAKYGGKTIILARFIPIVRTYAPFVAGASRMDYPRFLSFNIIGGVIWITSFLFAGYYFGNIPAVKHNFEYVVIGIIFVSIIPPILEWLKHRREQRAAEPTQA
jgi:membrane-associated protein